MTGPELQVTFLAQKFGLFELHTFFIRNLAQDLVP